MVGYSDKHKGIGNFRVDRICKLPSIMEAQAVPEPIDFSIDDYIKTSFRMYNSERKVVELICENSTMEAILDRFGLDVQTYANDLNSFRVVADIAVSHVFYAWVFGFGGKVRIKSPADVRDGYIRMVREADQGV